MTTMAWEAGTSISSVSQGAHNKCHLFSRIPKGPPDLKFSPVIAIEQSTAGCSCITGTHHSKPAEVFHLPSYQPETVQIREAMHTPRILMMIPGPFPRCLTLLSPR